jgi:heptosyltransferase-1
VTVRSLLIIRLSALGDAVHVLPALSALRAAFPEAKIGWAVEDKASSLLVRHPQLDRVHVLPRKDWTAGLKQGRLITVARGTRGIAAELRREHYEVALDFQSNFRSGLLTYASGAPRRIGQPKPFAKEGSATLFFTDTPDPVAKSVHKIDRNLQLLTPLGVRPETAPRGVVGETDCSHLEASLPDAGRPLVLLHAGVSAFGAIKAWREERFAELGQALAGDGVKAYFLWGGEQERVQAERLSRLAPDVEVAPPTGSILELAWFLRQADLFVGVDSGPLHLAAVQGTRVLGLYGPKHPGTYGPYWPGSRVARSGEHCSPCRHRKCPRDDVALVQTAPFKLSPCMESLTVARALEEARAILTSPTGTA